MRNLMPLVVCCIVAYGADPVPPAQFRPLGPVAFSQNSQVAAMVCAESGVIAIDCKEGSVRRHNPSVTGSITSVALSANGDRIFLAGSAVCCIDSFNGKAISESLSLEGRIRGLAVIDEDYVAALTGNAIITKLKLGKKLAASCIKHELPAVSRLHYNKCDKCLYAFGEEATLMIHIESDARQVISGLSRVWCVAEANLGKTLICGCRDGRVCIVDCERRQVLRTIAGSRYGITCVSATLDQKTGVYSDTQGEIRAFALESGERLNALTLKHDVPRLILPGISDDAVILIGQRIETWNTKPR